MFHFADDDQSPAAYEACPQCHVGRVRTALRPYLQLFRGHLFTIPDARSYSCDACDYVAWDRAIIDIVDEMMTGAARPRSDTTSTPHRPPLPTDDDAQPPTHYTSS